MSDLPEAILSVLQPFASVFSQERVFRKACTLLLGCLLCLRDMTVCGALRALGRSNYKSYSCFHRLLNRNRWNMLKASEILLRLIVESFCPKILMFSIDDTIERRRGKKIKAKGVFKDPVGSGTGKQITCSGLRWVPVMILIQPPFMKRTVALPFLIPLSLSERTAKKLNRRHKSPQRIAEQVCCLLRRWFPDRTIALVADSGYTTTGLYRACQRHKIQLVTRARSNLRFYGLAPCRTGKRGRPRVKGDRLPSIQELARSDTLEWREVLVDSYGGVSEMRYVATLDVLWNPTEGGVIEVRLVFVKNPEDGPEAPVFCLMTSDSLLSVEQVIGLYSMRWSQEVTHRETREHLGVETQRQWSDLAIERTTPLLFGVYSLVFLIGHQLYKMIGVSPAQASWYQKSEPAFSDLLQTIRALIREHQLLQVWASHGVLRNIPYPKELLTIFQGMGMAA